LFGKKTSHIQLAEQIAGKFDLSCEILQDTICITDTREGGKVYVHARYEFEVVDQKDYWLLEKIVPEFINSRWELVFKVKILQIGEKKCPPAEVLNGLDFLNAMRWCRWMRKS